MKYFPLILVVVLFPIAIADSTLALGVRPALFAEDVATVKVKIINKMDDFEMARFDGVKLTLGPLGNYEHESSEINTKGQLGFCEFLEPILPGEYWLNIPIIRVTAKVVIPPSPDSTVSMDITISLTGVAIQTSLNQGNENADKEKTDNVTFLRDVTGKNSNFVQIRNPDFGDSLFSQRSLYFQSLRELLLGEHEHRLCQAFILPSSSPEWAIYLVRNGAFGGETQVVYKRMWVSLRQEFLNILKPKLNDKSISTESIQREALMQVLTKFGNSFDLNATLISSSTAALLEQVWSETLSRVSMPNPEELVIELGEQTYYLSNNPRSIESYSYRWFPGKGSYASKLVDLVDELREYAIADEKKRSQMEISIDNTAKVILRQLNRRDI